MEKYGFVYIWRDKKYNRYYIGCHWGTEDDGYICSSTWMRNSYKRRPKDFKRKIICRTYTSKEDLYDEEFKWLQFIKENELGKRYYNLRNHHFNHWSLYESERLKIGEITRQRCLGKKASDETKKKMSESQKNRWLDSNLKEKFSNDFKGEKNPFFNRKHSEETKEKISEIAKNRKLSDETKKKISESSKGRIHSEETREKLRNNLKGRVFSEETRKKMSEKRKEKIKSGEIKIWNKK